MPLVPTDLFRCGTKYSPRLDNLRPQDIVTRKDMAGSDEVIAGDGGVSLFSIRTTHLKGIWWWVGRGEWHDPRLTIKQGAGNHWTIEPSEDMPLVEYVDALRQFQKQFTQP